MQQKTGAFSIADSVILGASYVHEGKTGCILHGAPSLRTILLDRGRLCRYLLEEVEIVAGIGLLVLLLPETG